MGILRSLARRVFKYDPVKEDGKKKPIHGAVAVDDPTDKYSSNPSDGLTAVRLARIFKAANEGDIWEQMELFEEMEEKDAHLSSQLTTRKLAVTGLDYEVQPFSDDERDQEIAEFVSEQFRNIENMDDIFMDLLDAVGKGIAISEIVWDVDSQGHNIISDIKHVYQKKLIWDATTDEMKIITRDFPEGLPIPANKFVIHQYKAKSGHPSRAGILRVVSWMYLFKNYDIKDWVSFCEVFGMPLRLGKYDPSASEEDKKALMNALIQLGTDAAGMVPSNTAIEFVQANQTSSIDLYEKLARYCDEQMSKAIVGQTLSADSGGSLAQGKVHDNVRHDLTKADAKSLAVTIRRDIIRPLVQFNFGEDANIPTLSFDYEDTEDLQGDSEILKNLKEIGLKIPVSYVYKKFRIPKPEDDEEVLESVPEQVSEVNTLKLKESIPDNRKEQRELDEIVNQSNVAMQDILAKLIEPVINKVDKSDSLEALLTELKDKKTLASLYSDMDELELSDLIHQAAYMAAMIGRTQEDG